MPLEPLEAEARAELLAEGVPADRIRAECRAHLRYDGTDTPVPVPIGPLAGMMSAFEQAYRRRFSFLMPDKTVVAEAVSVEVIGAHENGGGGDATAHPGRMAEEPTDSRAQPASRAGTGGGKGARAENRVRMFTRGAWAQAGLFRRAGLRPGQAVDGPAIIAEDLATTIVEPGWRAVVTERSDLLLSRVTAQPAASPSPLTASPSPLTAYPSPFAGADPVMLEIFNNLFMSVAEQMGVRLQSTAHSVNIKERLDFSCAIFDAGGGLIANAPHIPVHLGSMGDSIKTVINRNEGRMKPGDVCVLNDPYHGGTHLPDITVVTPVFEEGGRATEGKTPGIWFYVASRGHHAEIGGISPGSMPAFSRRVEEEGVLIDNWLLVEHGTLREAETIRLLTSAGYPSRDPVR